MLKSQRERETGGDRERVKERGERESEKERRIREEGVRKREERRERKIKKLSFQ